MRFAAPGFTRYASPLIFHLKYKKILFECQVENSVIKDQFLALIRNLYFRFYWIKVC